MNKKNILLLKKVLPQLFSQPEIMFGYDITNEEIDEIVETGKMSLGLLKEVAGDDFFEVFYKKLKISYLEARVIRKYLVIQAKEDFPILKEIFPFLIL